VSSVVTIRGLASARERVLVPHQATFAIFRIRTSEHDSNAGIDNERPNPQTWDVFAGRPVAVVRVQIHTLDVSPSSWHLQSLDQR